MDPILKENLDHWFEYNTHDEAGNLEIQKLIDSGDFKELHDRMDKRIEFGTAGLRSRMEAGWNRMNKLTVLQASQGLSSFVIKNQGTAENTASIVIGHDHRYNSMDFAQITASCFLNCGIKVYYLNTDDDTDTSYVHTPLVPFAVDHFKASCGVMITASHNPKLDNGYKVYNSNGCQIIPPYDKLIADEIEKNLKPRASNWDFNKSVRSSNAFLFQMVKSEITELYIKKLTNTLLYNEKVFNRENASQPFFAYTPMHGVGYEILNKVLNDNKIKLVENKDYVVVPEQLHPDPAFPTVSFPNPEEDHALDMGIALAEKLGIHLVLANDPDADRFSAAVRLVTLDNKVQWKQLNGNEIGILFAQYLLKKNHGNNLAMINSTVSSSLLKSMSITEDFKYEETLTGFKWLGNRAIDLCKEGYNVIFGYEEAIGYMFPKMLHDKDGILALIVFLQLYLEASNNDVIANLEECYSKYGYYQQHNGYYKIDVNNDSNGIDAIFNNKIRKYLQENKIIMDVFKIIDIRDLTKGYQMSTQGNIPDLPVDANSEMVTVYAESEKGDKIRFTLRGSGTEPKLKIYIECRSPNSLEDSKRICDDVWEWIGNKWID
ncbi:phosphoribomutase PRM15 SCDLUD_001266 [Saccharomycodes ludwigii]|uniref:phosphoribomutase PRM15 n=1 Tax=Saccharomycodes ludwigii TaxID=36035 RepID=UPI001E85E6D8|nr:hypothetical protein SCDLUD_001266 [Saccharomycodes ludwigii]KAH3903621.1 hypothetical protein SCDLUD_001266 [Saccharomycodes ludwigii]